MINGAHVIVYSNNPEADRAFFADVMGRRYVDAGGGWLIFELPAAELAIHPTDAAGSHEFYFMCDDIDETMKELAAKGVEFVEPITDARWGRLTRFRLPGGGSVGIYEPRHPRATDL